MVVFVSPPRSEWLNLRPSLTEGEVRLAEYLIENLDDEWEVYLQVKINDIQPDVVVFHPTRGIMTFEVKDWRPGSRPLRAAGGVLESETTDGRTYVTDNAVDQAALCQRRLIETYTDLALDLGNNERERMVSAGVILTHFATEEAVRLLKGFRPRTSSGRMARYFPILGGDSLRPELIHRVVPLSADDVTCRPVPRNTTSILRSLLREPEVSARQRQPLPLDDQKIRLLNSPPASGRRRVRGAAGSGKSTLLAAQAARWVLDGKRVLFVGFNITLWHHFRDLAVRYAVGRRGEDPIAAAKLINQRATFTYLHGWIESICHAAGRGQRLRRLLADHKRYPEKELKELVAESIDDLEAGGMSPHLVDALCIDEAQDIDLDWWKLLERCVVDGGPAVLAADRTQRTYRSDERRWTDGAMKQSGFEGSWATLSGSHRLPESVVPMLRAFISEFIPDADVNLPEVALGDQLFGCDLRWTNVRGDELVERVTSALVEVLQPGDVAFADCAVLLPGHKAGVDFVAQWQGTHGGTWPVRHVFDRVREVSRRRKMNFWPGSPGLKASTIKSFKGWEARFVLLGIDELPAQGGADMRSIDRANALASIYVGLSRVNRSDLGSLLWVFCSEPSLDEFGSTHFTVRP